MTELADRLDRMHVQAALPGGALSAQLRNRTEVALTFAPGHYAQCNERDLERQLAGLAKVLWAARMREYYAAVSAAFNQPIVGESRPAGRRDEEFHRARAELVAEGCSRDGRIALQVRGMQVWTVRIADGTTRALDEYEFAAAARDAASELINDQSAKMRELKERVYG